MSLLDGDNDDTVYVQCPNKKCRHVFDSDETFEWYKDEERNPTVEHIFCPKCKASTHPEDKRRKRYDFDAFEEVDTIPDLVKQDGLLNISASTLIDSEYSIQIDTSSIQAINWNIPASAIQYLNLSVGGQAQWIPMPMSLTPNP